ncbi:hypothetical protein [Methanobrevibacter sp.]|uniref:hypothetical protein n=1 Tax=Methanobrevibacter sp. TaxID=66852 RepID=UPI003890C1CE
MTSEKYEINFEDKNFWRRCIKYALAKRMIKRGKIRNINLDVCDISENELTRLIQLNEIVNQKQ